MNSKCCVQLCGFTSVRWFVICRESVVPVPMILCLRIKTILAVKRAYVEGNKRCYACAIHTNAMSAKSYKN